MKTILAAFAAFALLLPARAAKAETDAECRTGGSLSDLALHTSGGVLMLDDDEQSVLSKRVSFELRYRPTDRLVLRPFFRLNSTTVELRRPDDQPFDAKLVLPWQSSAGLGADFALFRWRFLRFSVYGEADIPFTTNKARVSDIMVHDEGGDAVPVDIDAALVRDHVAISHDWRRFDLGLTLRADFGRFHPFIDAGYVHMPGRLNVGFDNEASIVLDQFDVDPDPSYNAGISSMFYSAGLDFDLSGSDVTLRMRATVAPIDHGWIGTGEAGFMVPLDFFGGR